MPWRSRCETKSAIPATPFGSGSGSGAVTGAKGRGSSFGVLDARDFFGVRGETMDSRSEAKASRGEVTLGNFTFGRSVRSNFDRSARLGSWNSLGLTDLGLAGLN